MATFDVGEATARLRKQMDWIGGTNQIQWTIADWTNKSTWTLLFPPDMAYDVKVEAQNAVNVFDIYFDPEQYDRSTDNLPFGFGETYLTIMGP